MATNHWRTGTDLNVLLRRESQAFEFPQAVKLLCTEQSEAVSLEAIDQSLRFSCHDGDEFPASEVVAVHRLKEKRNRMVIAFFGLMGQHSPLPQPYQQWVRENAANDDPAFRDFLDIFNHRLIALLFMVLAKHRPALDTSTPAHSAQGRYLNMLMGAGLAAQQEQLRLPNRGLQAFAGLMANRRISLPRIKNLLEVELQAPVYVQQFVGGWAPLAPEQCTRLTTKPGSNGRDDADADTGKRLGYNAVLGSRIWNQAAGIALYLGPMDWHPLTQRLPGERGYERLRKLVLHLTEQRWPVDIYLMLKPDAVPRTLLTADADKDQRGANNKWGGSQLGRSSWLRTQGPRFQPLTESLVRQLPHALRRQLGATPTGIRLKVIPEHMQEAANG